MAYKMSDESDVVIPWTALASSQSKIQFIRSKLKIYGNYLNFLKFPNSKKNSFHGNYMRIYRISKRCLWLPLLKSEVDNLNSESYLNNFSEYLIQFKFDTLFGTRD